MISPRMEVEMGMGDRYEADFEHKGVQRTVVAYQYLEPILGLPIATDDSIEVDGKPLALTKVK